MKTALITGGFGQDGSYLAAHLLERGYRVVALHRGTTGAEPWRFRALGILDHPHLRVSVLDVTDLSSAVRVLERERPDEIYNLAAQSFVGASFEQPVATGRVTGMGALNMIEAVRRAAPRARFYQASTSDMFGVPEAGDQHPRNELSPLRPRNPYAAAKAYAHHMVETYRDGYGLFASCGILFNHESPLRGEAFVTRKITDGVARIRAGEADTIALGNLSAARDWGFAGDYVRGMHAMLQADSPGSFILATGRSTTVREFCSAAFRAAGLPLRWRGEGRLEEGVDADGTVRVRVSGRFYRPTDPHALTGDASRARAALGWEAATDVDALCRMMVEADLRRRGVARTLPAAKEST